MTNPLATRIAPLLPAFDKNDIEVLTGLVVLVAYADGVIDAQESDALRGAFETMLGMQLAPIVVNTFIGTAVDEIKVAGGDAYAEVVGKQLREKGKSEDGLRLAIAVAALSGGVSDDEHRRLQVLAAGAGVSESRLAELEASERARH